MSDFKIHFSHPWLLLLLIPAIILSFYPYFRLSKRYRRNRNRITSLVLHTCILTFSILVLAGTMFLYSVPNKENEIILLVDVSDTEESSQASRDEFVRMALEEGKYDNFNIGIVTFGFDQKYAVPLTDDLDEVYDRYLAAEKPDTGATDIAAALNYAKDLFHNPQAAKIVLITDGKETDERASSVILSVAAQGIKVDTVYVASEFQSDVAKITNVEFPSYHVNVNEDCEIKVTIKSEASGIPATVRLYDNNLAASVDTVDIDKLLDGEQTVTFKYRFTAAGLHEIGASLAVNNDSWEHNNVYCSYYNLESFNKILILERAGGESDALVAMINDQSVYDITVMNVADENVPKTVDGLRVYDQVILNNISHEDMEKVEGVQDGFESILYTYVNDYGGGVLTVGGNKEDGKTANTYDRSDMGGTIYQQLLPVQAVNYTPPLGLVVIIDTSGSMSAIDDKSSRPKFEWAKVGAEACLRSLTERDYMGVMTLDDRYTVVQELVPRTQETRILKAINSIEEANGGTVYSAAINRACGALKALTNVDKRHVIIITDGEPNDKDGDDYMKLVSEYYQNDGITCSIVGIGISSSAQGLMEDLVDAAGGPDAGSCYYDLRNAEDIVGKIYADLNIPEIKDVNYGEFKPFAQVPASQLFKDVALGKTGEDRNKMEAPLYGFYGTKIKSGAELVLSGDYEVPIYAQWKLGEGMVGSFMCDLNKSDWSREFMEDAGGKQFVKNVINNLFPTRRIRPNAIEADLKEDNYINQLSIYADLKDGESITGYIEPALGGEAGRVSLGAITVPEEGLELKDMPVYVTLPLDKDSGFMRCDFVVRELGAYRIILNKVDGQGNVLATQELYKSFAYSEEYVTDEEQTEEDLKAFLATLATRGGGTHLDDPSDPVPVFTNFITSIEKEFDPTVLLMTLAIVMFLLDIAVRKFKFKWIHELIRERKEKKAQSASREHIGRAS